MKKNVASQKIGVQMITAADGTAFTGTVTVVLSKDGGAQAASGGTGPTHGGSGYHVYSPTQAETNYDHVAFTFTGTGAIPATVQVYTTFPQTGDSFARIGAAGAGLTNIGTIATVTNLTNLPSITAGWLTATGIAADAITAAKVAADVHNETIELMFTYNATADYASATAGSAVKEIADNAGGSSLTAADIADAVWDEAVAGHVGAGTFGATDAAILADTGELQTDWANGGRLDLILDSVLADTNELQADDYPTTLATLATASALATVDTVVDGIQTDLSNGTDGLGAIKAVADSILTDTADMQPKLGTPAADVSADIAAVKADTAATLTDTAAIEPVTTALTSAAAAKLALSAAGIIGGTASGTPTTTVMESDLSGYANDELIGRAIIWTGGTANGQASDITDYASTSGTVTYTALTTAPVSGDTFVIV